MTRLNPKRKQLTNTIAKTELLLTSIVLDSKGEHWIKTIILNTDDQQLLQLMVDSVSAVDQQPFFYLYAENKLLRKYYSMLTKARFYRIKIDVVKYALHKRPNTKTHERGEIIGETYGCEPEITIVPNN